jgi:hypothetical protein
MKKIVLFVLLVFIGSMLLAGYMSGRFQFDTNDDPSGTPAANPAGIPAITGTAPDPARTNVSREHLEVSIGKYQAELPVFIDNRTAGTVSFGKPLVISVDEGHHTVKVCDGSACVQADVLITSGVKTVIDLGERLARDIPKGTLDVSIGDYNAVDLPVFIDNLTVGQVSSGKPLNVTVSAGLHAVRVCAGTVCENESVDIQSASHASVDFGERLARDVPKGTLTVSIGGYNAVGLPVLVDNRTAGEVSFNQPLSMKVSEGNHTVRVCAGMVCENASVEVKFAQVSYVDFGEQLKKDAEFQKPAIRILSSQLSGTTYTVNVEFINPDITSHNMTAVVGTGYTYIASKSEPRKTDFAKATVSQVVKAGSRQVKQVNLYLTKGSFPLAFEPTLAEVTIT